MKPTLLWLRRDLRLTDNPALAEAIARGGPVIPVFVLDPLTEGWGAAPRWRLEASLADLARRLEATGSRLVLRRGGALPTLRTLARDSGAAAVVWSRMYDSAARERDAEVKAGLKADGLEAVSVNGALLFEPWTVQTGSGGFYKVYTPFWRAVGGRDVATPLAAPARLPAPDAWPATEALADWRLGAATDRGGAVLAARVAVGEEAAQRRLDAFIAEGVAAYAENRDRLDRAGASGLSDAFATGELSPRTAWRAAHAAMERGAGGAATFLKELAWREFAYHLLFHTPRLLTENWKQDWDRFPWRGDGPHALRWKQGRTGEPVIDAAMREMHVTGRMHNRARMLAASYLCKHLMTHWKVGEAFFREHLVDWDVASNAMGWQWAAGSGPDAAPFFRIFNPATQAEKFDPESRYRRRWVAELSQRPGADALAFFDAAPRSWRLSPDGAYPQPLVDLKTGRERALEAYKALRNAA